jgi:adenylosuccinate lyase
MKALSWEGRFQDLLAADADLARTLPPDLLARCFDMNRALAHADAIVDRALAAL